jgi:hypothetical protein
MNKAIKTIGATSLIVGTLLAGLSSIGVPQTDAAPLTKAQHVTVAQQNNQQIIKQTKQLAAEGKTINSDNLGLGSTSSAIIKKWGLPDPNHSDKDRLDYYQKKKVVFELKKNKVTTVYSADKRFQSLTLKEIQKVLGKGQVSYFEDGYEVLYKAGKHNLRFIFGNEVEVMVN